MGVGWLRELTWIDDAWQVVRRRAYVLNGQERARALLREGVAR